MKITAKVERGGKWWVITVPEVEGAFTQAARLDQVEAMARSVVEDLLDIDGTDIEVMLDIQLPESERQLVNDAKVKLELSELAAAVASRANREAVTGLRAGGLTTREVATVLGISAGRVSQIEAKAHSPHASSTLFLTYDSLPGDTADRARVELCTSSQEWNTKVSRFLSGYSLHPSP